MKYCHFFVQTDLCEIKLEKQQKTNVSLSAKTGYSFLMNFHVSCLCLHLFSAVFSSFSSLKSIGTKEMTIVHSFLKFVTIIQSKRHYEVG